jgi:protoheme IX farnesyltransferase
MKIMTVTELCKPRISIPVTLSAVAGFVLSSHGEMPGLISMAAGMLILTGGCSALNQYQERDIDAHMDRTRKRPIPSGKISPARALALSVIFIVAGIMLIAHAGGALAAMLGLAGAGIYNGMYTFLKKKTAFAVVPGALVGAIPPAVGWVSAGGAILNFRLGVLCFFFFIWQMPHFWLFLLRYGEEYERAGMPSLTRVFSKEQLKRIVFTWTLATAASCQLLSVFGLVSLAMRACLVLATLLYATVAIRVLLKKNCSFESASVRLNSYMLIVLIFVIADRFLSFLDGQGIRIFAGL